ncbi:MAG: acyltransferase [Elusimicrobiota bacterium]
MSRYFVHPKALVERGATIGRGARVWAFAHVQAGAAIGRDCNIGDHCFVEKGARVGDRVTIKNGVSVWDGVTLEDDVFVGPNAVFTNDLNPRSHKKDWRLDKTVIRRGATIGANATLLCGLSVGSYALIGAGALLSKDAPPHALMIGQPARLAGRACFCGHGLVRFKSRWRCPHCGQCFDKDPCRV